MADPEVISQNSVPETTGKSDTLATTSQQTAELQRELEASSKTVEGVRRAFDLIKDNKEPQRYFFISNILDTLIYKQGYAIQE